MAPLVYVCVHEGTDVCVCAYKGPLVFNLNQILWEFLLPVPNSISNPAYCVYSKNLPQVQPPIPKLWARRHHQRTTPKGTKKSKFQVAGRFLTLPSPTKWLCYDQFPHLFPPIENLPRNAGNQRVLILHHPIPPPRCNVDTGWQPWWHSREFS